MVFAIVINVYVFKEIQIESYNQSANQFNSDMNRWYMKVINDAEKMKDKL